MHVERATKCNALFSPAGHYGEYETISLLHESGTGTEVTRHGVYAVREHASYVAQLMCMFLKDTITARGFFTHEDASEAHRNAHDALLRRLRQQ